MAYPTPVNGQITDAVTQGNVKVVAEAPAQAMGVLYQTMGNSVTTAMANGLSKQDIAIAMHELAGKAGVSILYPYDIPKEGITGEDIANHLQDRVDAYRRHHQ